MRVAKININLSINIFVIFLFIINEQKKVLCDEKFPQVKIPSGNIQGVYLETPKSKIYEAYLGVPYAKPPIGDLRFKLAEPVEPWIGTYNASRYGSDCLQFSHFGYHITGSEDCLFVNVYKPVAERNPDGSLFDVVVHFHGGAFMFYSPQGFRPDRLMDYDIVYVSVNYRLGPLGFMSTGDNVLPGNLGLKDQSFSLQWVKDNIKYFGGDPNKVTLTGVSAGGVSVQMHYLSPLSRGLFHKGMSGSGTVLNPWALTIGVPEKTKLLASKLGCPTSDSYTMIECLKQRPAEQIVAQVTLFLKWLYNPFTPFGPVIEPEGTHSPFLPRHPYDIIEDGDFAQVPWMSSFTSEEGLYPAAEFAENKELLRELEDNWYEIAPHLLDYNYTVPSSEVKDEITNTITKYYLKGKKISEGAKELVQMVGDRLFGAGIVQASLMQAAKSKSPVYMYRFAYRGKNSVSSSFTKSDVDIGVCHADDAGYIYSADIYKMEETEKDQKMGQRMKHLLISFVKNGVPEFFNGKPVPTVNEALPKIRYLEILSPDNAVITTKYDLAELQFWSTIPLKEKLKLPNQLVEKDEL